MSDQTVQDVAEEKAALKIASKKLKDNVMLIEFSYDNKLVLPYTDGLTILSCLKNAERYDSTDYNNPTIIPFKNKLEVTIFNHNEYLDMKVKHLLGVGKQDD